MHPTLSDEGNTVTLTLAATPLEAETRTRAGLRRLFALAIADEVKYYLESHPAWEAMQNQFSQLGTPAEFRDQLTCIVAERTFMDGQPAIRTQQAFEDRRIAGWGRLSSIARETCDAVARMLDASPAARHACGPSPLRTSASRPRISCRAAFSFP
jgi:ATP-dependent helicase HrpA